MRLVAVMAAAAALVLAGCGADGGDGAEGEPEATVLEEAYDTCPRAVENSLASYGGDGPKAPTADDTISVEDEGRRLTAVTPDPGGELMAGEAFKGAQCVLEKTCAPSSVEQKMGAASALSGPASDSWDNIEVEWSYAAGLESSGFQAFFEAVE